MKRPEPYKPCPCGSGKKYKFCCYQTDRDRGGNAGKRRGIPSFLPDHLFGAPDLDAFKQSGVLEQLGRHALQTNQFAEAEAIFREAIGIVPLMPSQHNNLALALLSQGRLDEAIDVQRHVVEDLDRNDVFARAQLAHLWYLTGQEDEARREARRLASLRPPNPEALGRVCSLCAVLKDDGGVVMICRKNRKLVDHVSVVHFAMALANQGELDAARRAIRELKPLDAPGYTPGRLVKKLEAGESPESLDGRWCSFQLHDLAPPQLAQQATKSLMDGETPPMAPGALVDLFLFIMHEQPDEADQFAAMLGDLDHPRARQALRDIAQGRFGSNQLRMQCLHELARLGEVTADEPQMVYIEGKGMQPVQLLAEVDLPHPPHGVVPETPEDPEDDLAAANAALSAHVSALNQQGLDDFHGLSPVQVDRLLNQAWNQPGSAIGFHDKVPSEAFDSAELFGDVVLLCSLIGEGKYRATSKGNLPRALVKTMWDGMTFNDWDTRYWGSRKNINEQNISRIHRARIVADVGGLIHIRSGVWTLVKKRSRLLQPGREAELFGHLMTIYLKETNLGYWDRLTEDPGVQYGIGYALAQLRRLSEWTEWNEQNARRLLLPLVAENYPAPDPDSEEHSAFDTGKSLALLRIVRPLQQLGLVEWKEGEGPLSDVIAIRQTPLFRTILRFDLEVAPDEGTVPTIEEFLADVLPQDEPTLKIKIRPGEPVKIKLSPEQRVLIDEHTFFGEAPQPGPDGLNQITLDDLEDLIGHVAAAANHEEDAAQQGRLVRLYDQLRDVMDMYCDQ